MKNPRKIFGDFVVFLLFESSETERHSLRFADFFSSFPVDEIHAVDERLNLLVHKVKVEFVHMFVARRIDRAEIIGGGNERDFGDMFLDSGCPSPKCIVLCARRVVVLTFFLSFIAS